MAPFGLILLFVLWLCNWQRVGVVMALMFSHSRSSEGLAMHGYWWNLLGIRSDSCVISKALKSYSPPCFADACGVEGFLACAHIPARVVRMHLLAAHSGHNLSWPRLEVPVVTDTSCPSRIIVFSRKSLHFIDGYTVRVCYRPASRMKARALDLHWTECVTKHTQDSGRSVMHPFGPGLSL